MKWIILIFFAFVTFVSCSNSNDFETGEIKAIKLLQETIIALNTPTILLDTRKIITRKKIDDSKIPVLFVELENGQNGTLTLYPGEGVGETWLGADGATITLENGIIKATRGMRNDVMGTTSSMPSWPNIKNNSEYTRQISYLGGDNQIFSKSFKCKIRKHYKKSEISIFNVPFATREFAEICSSKKEKLENSYFVDRENILRRSVQYHGPALGYLTIERLDR